MTKIEDVENDLAKYKTEAGERFEKLENSIESLRAETAKQHSEVMKLLLQQAQVSRPQPTSTTAVSTAAVSTQPFSQSSGLVFDEHGFPLALFQEVNSSFSGKLPPVTSQGVSYTGPENYSWGQTGLPPWGRGSGSGSGPSGKKVWLAGTDYRLRKLKMPLLSRRGGDEVLQAIAVAQTRFDDSMLKELREDLEMVDLRKQIGADGGAMEGYTIDSGVVRYKGRVVLPRTFRWIPWLFQEIHGSVVGGHEGAQKTYHRMAADFFWVGMRRDIAKLVSECGICQWHKYSNMAPSGLLQPLRLSGSYLGRCIYGFY